MAAGIFRADPSDGFPPGTPAGIGEVSWHGLVHFAVAGVGFICLVAACFVLAASLRPQRRSGLGLVLAAHGGSCSPAAFFALSSGAGGAAAILLFTAAVVLAWAWLAAVSVKLYRRAWDRP